MLPRARRSVSGPLPVPAAVRLRLRQGRPTFPCVLSALLLLGHPAAAQECGPGGTLEGRVVDAGSGVPLPGALVTIESSPAVRGGEALDAVVLEPIEVRADAGGSYRVCDLPFGRRLRVRATLAGEDGEPVELRLVPGRRHRRDLTVSISSISGSGPGRIVGRITDLETHRPVTSATVSVEPAATRAAARGTWRVATDGQGWFVVDDVPAGTYRVEIGHLGYAGVSEEVAVLPNRTVEIDAALSTDPVELEPLVVTTLRDRRLEVRGFYERRRWGERLGPGGFFTREVIEKRRPHRISQMIADLPGVRLRCRGSCCSIFFVRAPRSLRTGRACGATVYLDGVKVGADLDAYVLPSEVAGVEVYKGAASIPAEFGGSDAQCGVVAVWTRTG